MWLVISKYKQASMPKKQCFWLQKRNRGGSARWMVIHT